MKTVTIQVRSYVRRAWGKEQEIRTFNVFLGDFCLRSISEDGNMHDGYFGNSAERTALQYAQKVCDQLGQPKPVVYFEGV